MKGLVSLAALLLVATACGSEGSGPSSTQASTTTLGSTTTTTVAGTTTTLPETTTTSQGTTTTTTLPGNWAPAPLVVSIYGALGWWDGANWIQVDEVTTLPVSGGEDYRVVLFGSDDVVTGGAPETMCEPVFNTGVDLSDTSKLGGGWPEPVGVAISAPWDLTPHFVALDDDEDGTYSELAKPLLAARGLDVDEPVIKQVVRFDLEGDGINEVIVVAEFIANSESQSGQLFAQDGDYSLVFMRRVVDNEVETWVLGESIVTALEEGETPFILSFVVAAIADLSGDGKMEIVLNDVYYEGIGWTVWEYVNDDLGPVYQIGSGCGV